MPFELTDDVQVDRDDDGQVMQLEHVQQPVVAIAPGRVGLTEEAATAAGVPTVAASTPQALAEQYLREVAPIYGLDEAMLPGGGDAIDASGLTTPGEPAQGRLELTEEKEVMGTTVVSYQQTYHGLPVWEAGVSVTMLDAPLRVTASQSSVHSGVDVVTDDALAAEDVSSVTVAALRTALGLGRSGPRPRINGTPRRWIYAYDPNRRFDPEAETEPTEALQEGPPTLPLPPLPPTLVPGQHYVVIEVLFTLAVTDFGDLHWRAFLEETTGAVVYLRAFVASATGLVFRTDPLTAGGVGVVPTAAAAVLNPFRSNVQLEGLAAANPQELQGAVVEVVDLVPPVVAPPAAPNPPASFAFDAVAREFAAVNAYHHCDWLFRQMQDMGFNLATFFDGTAFPVPVDACAFGDQVNARAPGNVTGTGSGGFQFGLAGAPFPAVSIAADVRVVLHEFGHTLLWDSVHSPNFGFAHSAGDSLAAVLLDPESSLRTDPVRRFETFPWILPNRNHGRDVAAGWGWGGANDVGSYSSEQILSTTMFRFYRSLGGDAAELTSRRRAARETAYLIFRAIGSLASNPVTPTPKPTVFATALMNADIGTGNFEGYRGGGLHKVLRWAFEKQGLYQPPAAPVPVTAPGAPPAVDVYVDDGRGGEYPYQPVHWECTEVWNRLDANSGGGPSAHQTPVVGPTNHAFVRVRNRGTQPATGVVVRGYSADPSVGLSWPGDWTPMDDPQIAVAGGIPAGGSVIVGPFAWQPQVVGHECMFMEVSAPGDRSNIDPATFFPCAVGPTPEWRLVPYDNNVGQRNVCPVPGGGGVRGLLSGFVRRFFTVCNPLDDPARIRVVATMPRVLADNRWQVRLARREGEVSFGLAPGAERKVTISVRPGRTFSAADVEQDDDPAIRVRVFADDTLLGGMTYRLDPLLDRAPAERQGTSPVGLDDPEIEDAMRDAGVVDSAPSDDLTASTGRVASPPGDAFTGPDSGDQQEARGGDVRGLLSHIGLAEALGPRAHRVTVRELTVEVELE
jgi:zinc metalloprotease ZmpB